MIETALGDNKYILAYCICFKKGLFELLVVVVLYVEFIAL